MKKFVSLFIAFLVILIFIIPVFADVGDPMFEDWYVRCGIDGYDFTYEDYNYDTGVSTKHNDRLEPGIRLMVYDFSNKNYTLVIDDENYKGNAFMVYVPESDLKKCFIEENEIVDKSNGTQLLSKVKCKVDTSSGIVLRQGPATTFKKLKTIPNETELTFSYTYSYGGYNWAFVEFDGQNGWACIDYTKQLSPSADSIDDAPEAAANDVTDDQSEPATQPSESSSTSIISTNPSSSASKSITEQIESSTLKDKKETASESFFSSTDNIIITVSLAVIIIAITAGAVVIIIIKKKN